MKVKLLKSQCQAEPAKYIWKIGKGCFTIMDSPLPIKTKTKKCAQTEILNPRTNRCVKRDGKLGQSIINSSPAKAKSFTNKKLKFKKGDCISPNKWIIGKGCFSPPKHIKKGKTPSPPKKTVLHPIVSPPPCPKMDGFGKFNCKELPLNDIKYIIGPCSFYYFKYKNRNIYLFGEHHQPLERSYELITNNSYMTEQNTIMFAGLVHSLATQNPKKTYDLMYEATFFLEKKGVKTAPFGIKSTSPTIDSINNTFFPCLDPLLRVHCPYKNLRTHYVDYRRSIDVDKKHVLPLESFNPHPDFNSNVLSLLTTGKVLKQISSIKDPDIRKALIQYTTDFLFNKDYVYFNRVKHMIIMDIYGISRLFREFDNKIEKNNTLFKGTSENIIYYAGALHTTQMAHFFTKYLRLYLESPNIMYCNTNCKSFIKLNVAEKSLNFI